MHSSQHRHIVASPIRKEVMMAATTIDLARDLKEFYTAQREPALIHVPEFPFLMIDGHGDPNVSSEYRQAIEALYSLSYTLKFALKRGPRQLDYRVMPLEGLWWVPDMSEFSAALKSNWDWTMMIRQPQEVDRGLLTEAVSKAVAKKPLPAASLVRLEQFREGAVAQIMHIGPYAAEAPTIERLHAFIAEQGYERVGKHHEIYLGDPRRSAPEKLRTIIRQPVR
jgi:hypothetical protein